MSFDAVMHRLREALGAKDNMALAAALDMKPSAFYSRRSSASVPLERVVSVAAARAISCDWVLFGVGTMDLAGKKRPTSTPGIDSGLFSQIAKALKAALPAQGLDAPNDDIVRQLLAVDIYNRVSSLKPGSGRNAAIASEAAGMASAMAISQLVTHASKLKRGRT